jgi:DNA-binding SARP family transcriptional activator/pimeloyl-ACP methyl ester carboxylesterase
MHASLGPTLIYVARLWNVPGAEPGNSCVTTLTVKTFGYPELSRDGRPVSFSLRKGMALLVYLADTQQSTERDQLATLLWPESGSGEARAALRRTLHRVHAALGAGMLTANRASIQWSVATRIEVDAHAFERACDAGNFEAASDLYRGDFLAGFSLADCPEFENWAFFRREALRGRFMQALERSISASNDAGEHALAAAYAARLVALDPLSEMSCRHLIRSLLLVGDRASAQRHYAALTERLRGELDVAPEEETRALIDGASPAADAMPRTRYTQGANVHLAFQTFGTGPLDILLVPGFVSHVERIWQEPRLRACLRRLEKLGRVILFDRRGTGLSDRIGLAPDVEATANDIRAVLDAASSRRAILFAASEGGPACISFAAQAPERLAGLVLFGSLAKGSWTKEYPYALRAGQYETWLQRLVAQWGSPAGIDVFAPSLARDAHASAWWAGLLRAASSPGAIAQVIAALRDTDVREILPSISLPTLIMHRSNDRAVRVEAGRHLAATIPGAHFVELAGSDHWFWAGERDKVLEHIEAFIAKRS